MIGPQNVSSSLLNQEDSLSKLLWWLYLLSWQKYQALVIFPLGTNEEDDLWEALLQVPPLLRNRASVLSWASQGPFVNTGFFFFFFSFILIWLSKGSRMNLTSSLWKLNLKLCLYIYKWHFILLMFTQRGLSLPELHFCHDSQYIFAQTSCSISDLPHRVWGCNMCNALCAIPNPEEKEYHRELSGETNMKNKIF